MPYMYRCIALISKKTRNQMNWQTKQIGTTRTTHLAEAIVRCNSYTTHGEGNIPAENVTKLYIGRVVSCSGLTQSVHWYGQRLLYNSVAVNYMMYPTYNANELLGRSVKYSIQTRCYCGRH